MPKGKKGKRGTLRVGPLPENEEARKTGRVIALSRQNVLIRELDTAIYLWFFGLDPVSIHLLASSAHRCLDDIGKKAGLGPKIRQMHPSHRVDKAYDFFRHASTNLNIVIDFAPEINQPLIWDSINAFEKIFGGRTVFMKTFAAFTALELAAEDPNFLEQGQELFFPDGFKIENVRHLKPSEFFGKMLPVFAATTPKS